MPRGCRGAGDGTTRGAAAGRQARAVAATAASGPCPCQRRQSDSRSHPCPTCAPASPAMPEPERILSPTATATHLMRRGAGPPALPLLPAHGRDRMKLPGAPMGDPRPKPPADYRAGSRVAELLGCPARMRARGRARGHCRPVVRALTTLSPGRTRHRAGQIEGRLAARPPFDNGQVHGDPHTSLRGLLLLSRSPSGKRECGGLYGRRARGPIRRPGTSAARAHAASTDDERLRLSPGEQERKADVGRVAARPDQPRVEMRVVNPERSSWHAAALASASIAYGSLDRNFTQIVEDASAVPDGGDSGERAGTTVPVFRRAGPSRKTRGTIRCAAPGSPAE